MFYTLGSIFLMIAVDDAIGLGLNLIYFEKSKNLQFMLKFLRLKIVVGQLKEV